MPGPRLPCWVASLVVTRLAAALVLLGLGLGLLAAPAAGAATLRPLTVTAAGQSDYDDPDQPDEADEQGHESTKPLAARSILVTLAVIVVAGLGVVLAGLGYFSPGRD